MNQALLFKQAWRIHHNGNLLFRRVLKGKYGLLVDRVRKKKLISQAAWGYCSLYNSMHSFLSDVKILIGIGRSTDICEDTWVSCGKIQSRNSVSVDLFHQSSLVDDLIQEDKSLDLHLVWKLFPPYIAKNILATHLSKEDQEDYPC